MSLTKTYTLPSMGTWTAAAVDSTGTYETSETSNSVSNVYMLHHAQMQIANLKETKSYTIKVDTTPLYSISVTHTNLNEVAGNPIAVKLNGTATLNYTADGTNYKMPTSITVGSTTISAGDTKTVSGVATFLYTRTNDVSGSVYITNPAGNISYSILGANITYTITPGTLSNITASSSNPTTINAGGTAKLKFTANSGYKCPSANPTVRNASISSWSVTTTSTTADTGTLTIANPSGNVTFDIIGEELPTLAAPTISLSGDVLSIVDNDGNATSFDIYVDGTYKASVTKSS